MGTTLTGTTPQDTYDSLIKVTDNGPLSGTAKYLSDGLGNDSALALSTSKVGIGTASPTGKLSVSSGAAGGGYNSDYDELVLTNAGRVGINILSSAAEYSAIIMGGAADNVTGGIYHKADTKMLSFATNDTFRMNIDSSGNVGIGTSAPAQRLDISNGAIKFDRITTAALTCNDAQGLIYSLINNIGSQDGLRYTSRTHRFVSHADSVYATIDSDGLKFGSDTAAANALDDYEEGTFTAVLNPSTSGTFTLNATFNQWSYTKIGRQVTIKGLALVSSVASPVGTEVYISGLPFTILNLNSARGSAAVTYLDQSASTWSSLANKHSINNTFLDIQIDASTVAANDEFYVTLTYFTA